MQIQLIRNATLRLTLAGKTILTDPVLSPRHAIDSFAGIERNPTVDPPLPVEDIIRSIDLVMISHLHRDHFDDRARQVLPKSVPILCQPGDEKAITEDGFTAVTPLNTQIEWEDIRITRTPGRHAGNKKWTDILGKVSGFVLEAENEPVVYWAGDTILCEEVETVVRTKKPDIILTHSCGAVLKDSGPIVMDALQTVEVCKMAPDAVVIAVHMEALDHGTVSREDLRLHARQNNIPENKLLIPDDGQVLTF